MEMKKWKRTETGTESERKLALIYGVEDDQRITDCGSSRKADSTVIAYSYNTPLRLMINLGRLL